MSGTLQSAPSEAALIPHAFPFDPTHGHGLEDLLAVAPPDYEPPDFDAFWRGLRGAVEGVRLDLEVREEACPEEGFRLLRLRYAIGEGFHASAWLTVPADTSRVRRGVIATHGYDGRFAVEPRFYRPGMIVVLPVAPGFGISADPRLPRNDALRHVLVGIESPHTYVLGRCAGAIWRSIDAAQAWLGRPIEHWHYFGWSFGGGMGALALPWEPRVRSAELGQPTFGHHPLRLEQPSTGSASAVRQRWLQDPQILQTLSYFDSALSVQRLHIPTVFACALFDPAVTPPGQFAVANAHPGPKRISCFLTGHYEFPHPAAGEEGAMHRRHLEELIGEEFVL